MTNLTDIANRHGTDKGTTEPDWHAYSVVYERLFQSRRLEALTILEIGVFNGASIATWCEYFPNATVVGLDDLPHQCHFTDPRFTLIEGNQGDREGAGLSQVVALGSYDIIIDDGGHEDGPQRTSMDVLFPHLNAGGLYCVEDLTEAHSLYRDAATSPGAALYPSRYPGRYLAVFSK